MKLNQSGRTMLEMLGVLAIIGVISLGGLNVINRAQHEQKVTTLVSDTSQAAMRAKKLACQYDDGYSSYSQFIYRSNAYPNGWTYTSSTKTFTGVLGVTYSFSGNAEEFTMTIGGLDEEMCMKMAAVNWGNIQSSGLLSIKINDGTEISSGSDAYPVGVDVAAEWCSNTEHKNEVLLTYRGCR